jgi:flagellar basal body P-ring formation protein FlgA
MDTLWGSILRPDPGCPGLDKHRLGASIRPSGAAGPPYSGGVKNRLLPLMLALCAGLACAQAQDLARWTLERAGAPQGARVEVELGQLDPRLKLAPCGRIEPYLPAGSRPWGRSRIGLRCLDGATRWNVFLPITVRVFAPAPVLRESMPAGAELDPDQFSEAEVDWAERPTPPLADLSTLAGRTLLRPLAAGQPLRDADLARKVWFGAGEVVKVTAVGNGFQVSTEGQALGRGLDGQTVRVRTEGGRVVTGTAVGERRVEIPL